MLSVGLGKKGSKEDLVQKLIVFQQELTMFDQDAIRHVKILFGEE